MEPGLSLDVSQSPPTALTFSLQALAFELQDLYQWPPAPPLHSPPSSGLQPQAETYTTGFPGSDTFGPEWSPAPEIPAV